MHLYQGTSEQFIADAVQARLANQLADGSSRSSATARRRPRSCPGATRSAAMANVLQLADLTDQGDPRRAEAAALVEAARRHGHRLQPDRRRRGRHRRAQAVDRRRPVEHHRLRRRDFGGREVDHLHPSRQVAQYQRYLLDTHPAFTDGGDRARRVRLPPLRDLRPEVAAVRRRLRDAARDEPVLRRRPARRLRELPRSARRRPGRRLDPRPRRDLRRFDPTSDCSTTSPG